VKTTGIENYNTAHNKLTDCGLTALSEQTGYIMLQLQKWN